MNRAAGVQKHPRGSSGCSRTGRSNFCGEKAEDIELLVEHDHPGVNRDKIAHPAQWRFRSHIQPPVQPRRHVLECHLAAAARPLQPNGIRSMNLSIVDHALEKKVPALIAFKSKAPNYLEWSLRTIGENRDLRVRPLRRKIAKRFVVDGG
jgi:hypothetical protein